MSEESTATVLASAYFDGQRAQAQPVRLQVQGRELVIEGDGFSRRVPLRQVRWPERQRHGTRLTYLPGHGLISHADGAGWDDWARAQGLREPWVVRWMQSWRGVAWALVACAVIAGATWQWGVPWAGRTLVALIPPSLDEVVGQQALAGFDRQGLRPSQLAPARQAAIRQAFAETAARAYPAGQAPAYSLHFRSAGQMKLGPNAFALPGGIIVLTDELAQLLADAPEVTTGVLAHELGHVRHRHGMRTVVQASLLAAAAGWVVGDFSSVLAAVPAVLGQQAYARDFEREADQEAISVLRANGQSPERMVLLFERLGQWRQKQGAQDMTALPIAVADHPADAERMRVFREAAGR
ncbi:MAG TPA: M48 family metallopeptidase [Ideonella sp.]|nr:M48 family metallopeptidase [Ideonella sp.]